VSDSYNGYANYKTWNVGLWIDNNEGLYNHVTEEALEFYRDNDDDDGQAAIDLAEWLESFFAEEEALKSEYQPSVHSDLLSHAWGMVDWHELADGYIGELEE